MKHLLLLCLVLLPFEAVFAQGCSGSNCLQNPYEKNSLYGSDPYAKNPYDTSPYQKNPYDYAPYQSSSGGKKPGKAHARVSGGATNSSSASAAYGTPTYQQLAGGGAGLSSSLSGATAGAGAGTAGNTTLGGMRDSNEKAGGGNAACSRRAGRHTTGACPRRRS